MTTQPIRDKRHIHSISAHFLVKEEYRNHVLFLTGIHTALRISDMLCLTWDDVYDFTNRRVKAEFSIVEKKTKKSKIVAVNHTLSDAVLRLFHHAKPKRGDYLFPNPQRNQPISRIQAYRILRAAADEARVSGHVSCHSLRKTFGYHLWKSGTPLAVIMDIYNHSS
jgi:integrase